MYQYQASHGTIGWEPEHTSHAVTAMQEEVDELFSEGDNPVEVDQDTRQAVLNRYAELVENDPDIDTGGTE
jgi:hypothetical protein